MKKDNKVRSLEIEPQISFKDSAKNCWGKISSFISKHNFFSSIVLAIAVCVGASHYYKPRLRYEISTNTFVTSENLSDEVKNSFKVIIGNKEYTDLYITKVELTNTGAESLDGSKISSNDPIRIISPYEVENLVVFVDTFTSSKDVVCKIIKKDKDIIIPFNYINPDGHISISILHNERIDSQKESIYLTGSAMGLGEIKHKFTEQQALHYFKVFNVLLALASAFFTIKMIRNRKANDEKLEIKLKDRLARSDKLKEYKLNIFQNIKESVKSVESKENDK